MRRLDLSTAALVLIASPAWAQDVVWQTRLDRGLALPQPAFAAGFLAAPGGGVLAAGSSSATGAVKTLVSRYNVAGNSLFDRALDLGVPAYQSSLLASDSNGNTLLSFAGISGSGDLVSRYTVASLDATGLLRWKRFIQELPSAAVADAQGRYALLAWRYLTLIDSQGNSLWTREITPPHTEAYLALDSVGRFCVGYKGLTTPDAIGLECYDGDGTLQWRRSYSAGGLSAELRTMVARPGGGMYFGGRIWDGQGRAWLLAVDGMGDVSWSRSYGTETGHDYEASRLATLAGGDAIVAVQDTWTGHSQPVALRYDAAGVLTYERPLDLGVESAYISGLGADASSRAYLLLGSGPYFGPQHATTVLLDGGGNLVWNQTYAPNPTTPTYGSAIVVSATGGAFVQATSGNSPYEQFITTLRYSATGVLEWAKSPPPTGLDEEGWFASVDGLGRLIVAGSMSSTTIADGTLILTAIDPAGSVLWSRTPPAAGANGLSTDRLGNVFLASGVSEVSKLSSAGDTLWTVPLGRAIAADDEGGAFVGILAVPVWYIERYSASGALSWSHHDDATAAGGGVAPVVRQDGAGGVLAGVTVSAPGGPTYYRSDARILRLRGTGTPAWATTLPNPEQDADTPTDLAVDASGNTFVAVLSRTQDNVVSTVFDSAIGLVKLDGAGQIVWSRSVPAGLPLPHFPNSVTARVVLDGRGRACLAGSRKIGALSDILLVCYDQAGNVAWQQTYDAGGSGAEFSGALAVDGDGNLYVGGMAHDGPSVDSLVVKYDAKGNQVWAHRIDRAQGFDAVGALAVGFGGAVYAAGTSWAEATQRDLEATRYGTPPAPMRFHTLTPCRVLDTRATAGGAQPVATAARLVVDVAGSGCGVPTTARAVAGNVVAVFPTGSGHLVIHPAGEPTPFSSTLNYSAGQIRSANVTAGLAQGGRLVLRPFQGPGTVHLVFDVTGYFE